MPDEVIRQRKLEGEMSDADVKATLARFGISVSIASHNVGSSTPDPTHSWAAPYDPHMWDATRDLRIRMFGFALEFACGPLADGDVERAEAAFMLSRRWSDFHRGCLESGSDTLHNLSLYWASEIFGTAAFLDSGRRHFEERAVHQRTGVFRSYKVWGPPNCEHSPHAAILGYSSPIDDPIWASIIPPFDYSCGCMLSGEEALAERGEPRSVPLVALTSHDWMPIFPTHLKLKRFKLSDE